MCVCILKGCIKKAETAASLCNLPWCCWLYAEHLRHRQARKLSRVWLKNQIKNHRRCYYSWKYLLKTGYERKNKASGFVSHSVVIEMMQMHGTFHAIFCISTCGFIRLLSLPPSYSIDIHVLSDECEEFCHSEPLIAGDSSSIRCSKSSFFLMDQRLSVLLMLTTTSCSRHSSSAAYYIYRWHDVRASSLSFICHDWLCIYV